MGRYTGPKERLSRREGVNLYLKGSRSFSQKAASVRRPFAPGQHGNAKRVRLSNFGLQLREKQKVKRTYGLRERQFKNLVKEAIRLAGIKNTDRGLELLTLLETRLDNVVYMLGLAASKSAARQYVVHGHVKVNDKKMSIPSYPVKLNDKISLKKENLAPVEVQVRTPEWLAKDKGVGEVLRFPTREEIDEGIKENLIVEYYSR